MRPELDETLAAPTSSPPPSAPSVPASPPVGNDRTATAAPRATAADTDAASSGLRAGQQLGHFRIDRPLGAGGMGEVYLATDLALERPVAIKVLPDSVARVPARRDRLVREARAQARINHPNVGHIYFVGEEAGRLYFAMEYVAGDTVAALVAKGPLPPDDAIAIVRAAALGLRDAQRAGITHRDIKPSNLMIDGHGVVKLLDFGLATAGPGAHADGEIDGPVAQTSMAGTPLYMAPEQARGEPVDFRADIYALGATLYHLVAGKPPFEADTLDALLSKHSSADRPTVPRRPGLPRTAITAIDALCSRMMAPAAGDRFASYDDLLRALELASAEHMRPAGFVVRVLGDLTDLLLASLAGGLVTVIVWLLSLMRWHNIDASWLVMVVYVLGGGALIARYGRTPGFALFELEVVEVKTGKPPRFARAVQRNLIPVALPLAEMVLEAVLSWFGYDLIDPIRFGLLTPMALIPVLLLWSSWRSVSKQTIWDRRSGTAVRYRMRRQLV